MKAGRSLQEISQELTRQLSARHDYLVPTNQLRMTPFGTIDAAPLSAGINQSLTLKPLAHGQLASYLGIPKTYYDRLLANQPTLLAENVNTWLRANPVEKRLVRTLDWSVRAFLSDRYRPLDNYELTEAALPALVGAGCRVESAEITESHLYLKAVAPRLTLEPLVGDPVQAGVVISNSEVGQGTLSISVLIYRLVCKNGLIIGSQLRKYHVGRRQDEESFHLFTDSTKSLNDKAFWAKVQDVVAGALDETNFRKLAADFSALKQLTPAPKAKVEDVVTEVTDRLKLGEESRSGILSHLAAGGDLSAYGLVNAVTRQSQDEPDYEAATTLERAGGEMLSWPIATWSQVLGQRTSALI